MAFMLTSDLTPGILDVFLQRGYDGATLAHLARETGLSKASLYHHFPGGKSEMAATLVRSAIADLHARAYVPLMASDPPQNFQDFIAGFAGYVQQGQSDCILSIFARHDTAGEDLDELRKQIAAQFNDWHTLLTQAFEARGAKPKRADRQAHELVALLYGALMQAKMHNKPELFTRAMKRLQKEYAA